MAAVRHRGDRGRLERAIERRDGPTALLLSRQNLPALASMARNAELIRRGAYVLLEPEEARATVIATGSELGLAIEAGRLLDKRGISVRIVSMPSTTRFDRQSNEYRLSVLPPHLPAVAVEASQPDLWHKYVGLEGAVIGVSTFGESAPAPDVYRHLGLTPERIADVVVATITRFEARRESRPPLPN